MINRGHRKRVYCTLCVIMWPWERPCGDPPPNAADQQRAGELVHPSSREVAVAVGGRGLTQMKMLAYVAFTSKSASRDKAIGTAPLASTADLISNASASFNVTSGLCIRAGAASAGATASWYLGRSPTPSHIVAEPLPRWPCKATSTSVFDHLSLL